jgi:cytoskeletal protein RodZ
MPDVSLLFPMLLLGAVLILILVLLPLLITPKTTVPDDKSATEQYPLRSAETRPLSISRSSDTQPIQLND